MSDPLFARFGREVSAGEVLFREGEPGDVMFVIQSGAVRITKSVGGHDKTLAMLGPGEFFGELAILNGKPRTATATVVESLRCLAIEARTLEAMVTRNAEIALRLIKKLARRLDSADTLIGILMHRDPRARVMLALSRCAESVDDSEGSLRLRTSAEELADEVGVTREVAEEVLGRLLRLRLLVEERGGFVVADAARLRDFLELLEMPQKFGVER